MLSNVKNIFKVEDLRNKVLFTLAMIAMYRFGAALRAPGIDAQAVRQLRSFRFARCARILELVFGRRFRKLLHFCFGNHAVHHGKHHHAGSWRGYSKA